LADLPRLDLADFDLPRSRFGPKDLIGVKSSFQKWPKKKHHKITSTLFPLWSTLGRTHPDTDDTDDTTRVTLWNTPISHLPAAPSDAGLWVQVGRNTPSAPSGDGQHGEVAGKSPSKIVVSSENQQKIIHKWRIFQ
jgi:hypothetical protein